ncbi:MAG: cell division protein FtsQ/DivIB [Candidatus Nanopelagicaceae bacterium]
MKRILVTLLFAALAYVLGWTNVFAVKSFEVVDENPDRKTVIEKKLDFASQVGKPIARIDRRELNGKLRNLTWASQVDLSRNFVTGKVTLAIEPEVVMARLNSSWTAAPGQIPFLAEDLSVIYVNQDEANFLEVSELLKKGSGLPEINMGSEDDQLKGSLRDLVAKLNQWTILGINAPDGGNISSTLILDGRQLEVYWGNVIELDLKLEVLNRLLELKENRRAKSFDLSNPLSPIAI